MMNIKGQKVEYKEDHRQILLSVAKVVLNVIALVFERIDNSGGEIFHQQVLICAHHRMRSARWQA
jgi:hypothetical protein